MKVGDGEGDGAWRGDASDSVRGSTCLMAERVRGQDTNLFSHPTCTCAPENPQHVGSEPSNSPSAPCGVSAGRGCERWTGHGQDLEPALVHNDIDSHLARIPGCTATAADTCICPDAARCAHASASMRGRPADEGKRHRTIASRHDTA